MQSGQSLFCLSLRRLAILLTRAGSHLVTTLSVLLRCNLKRRRQFVFMGTSHMFNEEVDREGDNSWSGPKSGP